MTAGKLAGLIAAALLLAGCAGPARSADPPASGQLTVFAAASLTDAFDELAAAFAEEHPRARINPVVFDGSATLATQLQEGASADVFASADTASMDSVAGLLDDTAAVFARNTLQIAVPPGNPHRIRGLADLPGRLVVLCAPRVPCGAAARTLLTQAGVSVTAVSEEQNVKSVVTKVSAGEADAGLVYVTDVLAAHGAIDGVPIAGAERAANSYSIAVLRDSADRALAREFVHWILAPRAQAILAGYGFEKP